MHGKTFLNTLVQQSAMLVQHQIVRIAIQLLEAERGRVAIVYLVHRAGEARECGLGGGRVHLGVRAEWLDGEFTGGGGASGVSGGIVAVVGHIIVVVDEYFS